jgi:hypothetical protein
LDFVNYNEFASLQNRFWLQILGDHSRFILNATPSYEPEIVDEANYFKELFDALLDRSISSLTDQNLMNHNMQSLDAAYEIRTFKLNILKSILTILYGYRIPLLMHLYLLEFLTWLKSN